MTAIKHGAGARDGVAGALEDCGRPAMISKYWFTNSSFVTLCHCEQAWLDLAGNIDNKLFRKRKLATSIEK